MSLVSFDKPMTLTRGGKSQVSHCFSFFLGQHLFLPQVSHGDEADVGGEKMRKERKAKL